MIIYKHCSSSFQHGGNNKTALRLFHSSDNLKVVFVCLFVFVLSSLQQTVRLCQTTAVSPPSTSDRPISSAVAELTGSSTWLEEEEEAALVYFSFFFFFFNPAIIPELLSEHHLPHDEAAGLFLFWFFFLLLRSQTVDLSAPLLLPAPPLFHFRTKNFKNK